VTAAVEPSRAGAAGAAAEEAVARAASYAAAPLDDLARCAALRRAAELLLERGEQIAQVVSREVRKPIALARGEVERCAEVIALTVSEWETLRGEVVPAHASAAGAGHVVLARRHPLGVVCAITPFNFPVGLLIHKLAPALAAGNACVVKPSERAPESVAALVAALLDAGFPDAAVPVVSGGPEAVEALLAEPAIGLYSFTGSVPVGERIRAASGLRPVVLELGSNAATIVHHDADLARAARSLAQGAYAYAGQACQSVQRIVVHERVHDELVERLLAAIAALPVGDPADERVVVGPMIDEAAAERVAGVIDDARAGGATLLCGGRRDGALLEPALLDGVPRDCALWREEAFGPVAGVVTYDELAQGFALANDSRYGLQTGIFTSATDVALAALDALRAGAVLVNEGSHWRCTPMPFGGVGASGIGREGPRYAIEAMTSLRTAVLAR